jgi:sugar phosphate isomerase/epimerase
MLSPLLLHACSREEYMTTMTRRQAARLLAAGSAGAFAGRNLFCATQKIDSVIRGVRIGAQSYSFRDRPLDRCIEAYRETGIGLCELWSGHIEPRELKGPALRKWRMETPLSHFKDVRQKFENAGVEIYAYTFAFRQETSDEEIDLAFQQAKELGAACITSSANISAVARVDAYAQKHKIPVGFHGHDQTKRPDEFSTADTFSKAMSLGSSYVRVNLDIGHFTAAGGDPVEYIRGNHDRIVTLHIKDRKKNHGANVPFGQGDTPIADVLRQLRDNGWKIPANIEYEYGDAKSGLDPIVEVKKCYEFCRRALEDPQS